MENSLKKLKDKIDLNFDETKEIFTKIMSNKVSEKEMHEFLILLSDKGEVSSEIAAGVYVLREKSSRVNVKNAIDTCGTGGDGKNTLNISTASALLLASMGIKVAKHGNKAISSKCGSGDVLEKLNININLDAKSVENNINQFNFGFMFAPNFHSAMKFVGPVRKKIGKRTIFNMIGPLSSPALVKKQVVGVFDKKLLNIFANALKDLEITNAWIVNSEDGLDEISPYAITNVCQLKNGEVSNIIIDPAELKIYTKDFNTILGQDADYNSQKIIEIFKGENNDFSIAVCLNAAAGLIVSGNKGNFKEAYQEARDHILTGKTFDHLKKIQNGI